MFGWNVSEWVPLLAGVAVKSAVVLGAAWMAALLLRKQSAAARHVVWTTAFAALLALPLLSVSLPALRVPVAPQWLPPDLFFETTATLGTSEVPAVQPASTAVNTGSAPWRPNWRLWLAFAWLGGAALSFSHMLVGWIAVQRMRRNARPFPAAIEGEIDILETMPGSMPAACGLFRPVILLPADAREWSEERRKFVLLHEAAHVRRGDMATHFLARIALSLYWWNPLAWTAWREFLKERERAADDLVLNSGARASDYAAHLLDIARSMQSTAGVAAAAVPMARVSQLEGRLLAILDAGRNRASSGRMSVVAAALLAAVFVLPVAAFQVQAPATEIADADLDAAIRAVASARNPERLEQAAQMAQRLRKYDIARKLLDSALSIRAETSGRQSPEYATALLKLGDLERKRGRLSGAVPFYTEALSILGDRSETGSALIALGIQTLNPKKPDQAIAYLERARVVSPAHAASALMWMAVAREQEANFPAAEMLYQQALAAAVPGTPETATIMELYALFLGRQGRESEAANFRNQAGTLRRSFLEQAGTKSPGSGDNVYRIGGDVAPPKLLFKLEPEYSEEARAAKYQGTAVISVEIGLDGKPGNLKIQRSLGLGLDEKAIEAVNQWKFEPGTRNGQPVTVAATIEVNFRLL
ncbi:MAG TPA: TonB family protein [Bryobacteraceae bacterium]|nr:TonB family protein [Bryobacteraceae bacterium]